MLEQSFRKEQCKYNLATNSPCYIRQCCDCVKDEKILDSRTCLSSASLTWNLYKKIFKNTIQTSAIGNFDDKIYKEFVRKSIHGGRVAAYTAYWNSEDNKSEENILEDFDANSLYGSVMANKDLQFPDINSFETINITQQNNSYEFFKNKYSHFILECDIFVPKNLQFIPISIKDSKKGCYYRTGYHYNQCYNDIDILEAYKCGIRITNIHKAMVFKNSIDNVLYEYSHIL